MFGKTLVIVNPTARTGKAVEAAAHAVVMLERILTKSRDALRVYHTLKEKDATRAAYEQGKDFDTLIIIGGDGVVHEVVNGLMQLPIDQRPQVGLIPCGNGDDFARSLSLSRKPQVSVEQLAHTKPLTIDIGKVNDTYFAETLSLGLDAAIALQTMELRKQTGRSGSSLYLQCGIDQLKNHRDVHRYYVSFDGSSEEIIEGYLFAIQNGNSYGGGFEICPMARLNDGILNICYATPPLSFTQATALFMKAAKGKHTNSNHIQFRQAKSIDVRIEASIPTQIDGEALNTKRLHVELLKNQLTVLVPENSRYK